MTSGNGDRPAVAPAPAVFDLDEVEATAIADYPAFVFTRHGVTHELPHPALLPMSEIQELDTAMKAASSEVAGDTATFGPLMDLLRKLFGEAGEAICSASPVGALQLITAWQGEVDDQGKSVSPPPPRNREERRSKQTSRTGAKTSGRSRSAKQPAPSAPS